MKTLIWRFIDFHWFPLVFTDFHWFWQLSREWRTYIRWFFVGHKQIWFEKIFFTFPSCSFPLLDCQTTGLWNHLQPGRTGLSHFRSACWTAAAVSARVQNKLTDLCWANSFVFDDFSFFSSMFANYVAGAVSCEKTAALADSMECFCTTIP